MKELSIEDKAKRYNEALQRTRRWYDSNTNEGYRGIFEDIFPELKESKDEKIKKVIYGWIYTQPSQFFDSGFSKEEMLAWLEKQGEQKPVIEMKTPEESLGIDSDTYNKIVDECIYGEQKPADVEEVNFFDDFRKTYSEVEPKFHEGEWITDGNITIQIEAIKNNCYLYCGDCALYSTKTADKVYHLWTVQDAKPGDVLVNQNGEMPFIFKECKNNHIYCYCGYTNRKDIFFDRFVDSEGEELHWLNLYHEQAYPATKEQRNTLMKAMADAGYTFDFDKKELKKIEQKPAWSEEDDKILKSIIINIENLQFSEDMQEKYHHIPNANKSYYQIKIDWLKSLKYRVQPQLQKEWTEEDERIIKRIKSLLYSINENDFEDIYVWLKFLKDRVQPKQEWSKEDEGYYDAIIAKLEVTQEDALLTDNEMDFLKSLEKRVFPKSNWNEEDITRLKSAITLLQNPLIACDEVNDGVRIKTVDWLKFLEERYTWKPSDEQMRILDLAIRCGINRGTTEETTLVSLFNDLKKLI